MGENSYRLILDYSPPPPHSRIPRVIFVSPFFSNETSNGENGKTIDLIFFLVFLFSLVFSLNDDKYLGNETISKFQNCIITMLHCNHNLQLKYDLFHVKTYFRTVLRNTVESIRLFLFLLQ